MIRIILINFIFGFYVSFRIYRAFFAKFSAIAIIPILFVLTELFIIIRIFERYTGVILPDWLAEVSYLLLGYSVYLLLYLVVFDLLWVVRARINLIHATRLRTGAIAVVLAGLTFGYGYWHNTQTSVTPYILQFEKSLLKPLRVAAISDIHIGSGVSKERLNRHIATVNSYKPDIIFLLGDMIDNNVLALTPEFQEIFKKLEAPYGVYAVLGNHEYYSGPIPEVIKTLEASGMKVLKDKHVYLEEYGVYILGRDSLLHSVSDGSERMPIDLLTYSMDKEKPLIILDHVPRSTEDGHKSGAQLQLSGHTHAGQFVPITWIVKLLYPISHGLLTEGNFNLIVSSGLGLWGPPMRVGSGSEIMMLELR